MQSASCTSVLCIPALGEVGFLLLTCPLSVCAAGKKPCTTVFTTYIRSSTIKTLPVDISLVHTRFGSNATDYLSHFVQ